MRLHHKSGHAAKEEMEEGTKTSMNLGNAETKGSRSLQWIQNKVEEYQLSENAQVNETCVMRSKPAVSVFSPRRIP